MDAGPANPNQAGTFLNNLLSNGIGGVQQGIYNFSNGEFTGLTSNDPPGTEEEASSRSSNWNSLTKSRLVEIAESRGKDRTDAEDAFEEIALKSSGLDKNIRKYLSPERSARTRGRHTKVEPDGVGYSKVYDWTGRWIIPKVRKYPSSFADGKSVAGRITPSYDDYQVIGFIDAIANTMGGRKGRGVLTLYTTSDTEISEGIINYANQRNIALFQSKAYEWKRSGKITFGAKLLLNLGNTGSSTIWVVPNVYSTAYPLFPF